VLLDIPVSWGKEKKNSCIIYDAEKKKKYAPKTHILNLNLTEKDRQTKNKLINASKI
jgi:hypothetical protein